MKRHLLFLLHVGLIAACLVPLPASSALPQLIGDLNNDSKVDVVDLVVLINHLNGQTLLPASLHRFGDIDQNGILNLNDVDKLGDAILGLITPPSSSLSPTITAPPGNTRQTNLVLSGTVYPGTPVRIDGGLNSVTTIAGTNGTFSVNVPLATNRLNRLFVSAIDEEGNPTAPRTYAVIQDSQPPSLFIDFPADGSDLTTSNTTVAGRVGDMLSGFMGLSVNVSVVAADVSPRTTNSAPANVNVGIGNNGTFEQLIPLGLGTNLITATATDANGNTVTKQITIQRVPLTGPRMFIVSGDRQVSNIHRRLAQPIVVRVTQPDGVTPFPNKLVTFEVTRSDGRLLPAGGTNSMSPTNDPTATVHGTMTLQLFTDANGEARAWWALGGDAGCGNNRVCATSKDISGSVFFCASANPAPAAQVNVGAGNNQKAETGAFAPEPLRAWVSDGCNGVPGMPVTFTIIQGSGRLFPSTGGEGQAGQAEGGTHSVTLLTTRTGHAEALLCLGPDAGQNVIEATYPGNPGMPATFIAYGVARDPAKPGTLTGLVLDNSSQPIGHALCEIFLPDSPASPVLTSYTDTQGRFAFTGTPAGPVHFFVYGPSATSVGTNAVPPNSFPFLTYFMTLIPNAENSLPQPVLLPRLNPNNARTYYGTNDLVLTCEGITGLKMTIKANSMRDARGLPVTPQNPAQVSLNQVHHDQVPMPIPDGASPPFAWTLQPARSTFDPPITIEYPNMSGLPAGSIAYFLSFNHDTERFEIIASGHVAGDTATIVTDPGVGLSIAGWGCNCPPYAVSGRCHIDNCAKAKEFLEKDCEAKRGSIAGALPCHLACLAAPCGAPGTAPWINQTIIDMAQNSANQPDPVGPVLAKVPTWVRWPGGLAPGDVVYFFTGLNHLYRDLYKTWTRICPINDAQHDHWLNHEFIQCLDANTDISPYVKDIARVRTPEMARRLRNCINEHCFDNPQKPFFTFGRCLLLGPGELRPIFPAGSPVPPGLEFGELHIQGKAKFEVGETYSLRVFQTNNVGELEDITGHPLTRFFAVTEGFEDTAFISTAGKLSARGTFAAVPSLSQILLIVANNGNKFGYLVAEITDADTDGDGICDSVERRMGLDPNDPTDALLDPDNDGLSNLTEAILGTDPFRWDTDGDGLSDGAEYSSGLDPLNPIVSTLWFPAKSIVGVNGQTILIDGTLGFAIHNISVPDAFGNSGPGSPPDFVGDDYVRLVGTIMIGGKLFYGFSEFFQVKQGQNIAVTNFTFAETPPHKPESLTIIAETPTMTMLGQTTRLRVIAHYLDGSTNDVTAKTAWTSYRVSNPAIATVDENGVVTARNRGMVFVTAVNEGASAVDQIDISPGDPLTTVNGFVQSTNGMPAAGALISIIGLASFPAVTDAAGRFTLTNVPSAFGPFQLSAQWVSTNGFFSGVINVTPVPGGFADAGILALRPGVTWIRTTSSGNWTNATNWSTGRVPGPSEDVYISVPSNVNVTNSGGSNVVRSLLSDNRLVLSGGILRASNGIAANRSLTLSGGRLLQSTVASEGTNAAIIVTGTAGILDGVTLKGNLDVTANGSRVTVTNGLRLDATAYVGHPTLYQDGAIAFGGRQTLDGNGTVVFGLDSCNALYLLLPNNRLTIGSNITVRGRNGTIGYRTSACTATATNIAVTNLGTIMPDVSGGSITVRASPFVNKGTLNVAAGNLGLGGVVPTGSLGVINRVGGGLVTVEGTLVNTGTNFVLNGTNDLWELRGGTIRGGSIMITNGAALRATDSGGVLDGVVLNGDLFMTNDYPVLTLTNGLTLNGTAYVGHAISGAYGTVIFTGTQRLEGLADIVFGTSPYNKLYLTNTGTGLTIGPRITIRGHTGVIGLGAVTNEGVIASDVPGGTITIRANPFVNHGVINIGSGALYMDTDITLATLSGINRLGTGLLSLGGAFELFGANLSLNGPNNSLGLNGCTLRGGTITGTNGGRLFALGYSALDRMVLDVDLWATNSDVTIYVTNGLILNRTAYLGSLMDATQSGALAFDGTQTLSGTGTVVFGASRCNALRAHTSGAILTLGENITVRGKSGEIGQSLNCAVTSPASVTVINRGRIVTDVEGGTNTLRASPFVNQGVLSVGAGNLGLGGVWVRGDLGTLNRVGSGVVSVEGILNLTGTNLVLNGTNDAWGLRGGTIRNGVVAMTNGGRWVFPASTYYTSARGTLDGVRWEGDLVLDDDGFELLVTNGLTLNGIAFVGSSVASVTIAFAGSQTLSGNGTVVFGDSTCNGLLVMNSNTSLTIGDGIAVYGGTGMIGQREKSNCDAETTPNNIAVTNFGAIWTGGNDGTITLRADPFVNNGAFNVRGGNLTIDGSVTRTQLGKINRYGKGFMNLQGTLDLTGTNLTTAGVDDSWLISGGSFKGGTITTIDGGRLYASRSGGTLDGVTLNGDLELPANNARLSVTNGLRLNGTIYVGTPTNALFGGAWIAFAGDQVLDGHGTIIFGPDSCNALYVANAGTSLTIGSEVVVRGRTGQIGQRADSCGNSPTNISLFNLGTIMAETNGGRITVRANRFVNNGGLTVLNGTLNLAGFHSLTNLGTINRVGAGLVSLEGRLDLSATNLALNGTNGSWLLNRGTIHSGAITATNGSVLLALSGTLDGVQLNCHLVLTNPCGGALGCGATEIIVTNGLTLNGTAYVGSPLQGQDPSYLAFGGSQLLTGNGTVIFNNNGCNAIYLPIGGTALTIDSGITVRGQNGQIGQRGNGSLGCSASAANVGVTNKGTISANVNGGTLYIRAQPFINLGTTNQLNGGTLIIQ